MDLYMGQIVMFAGNFAPRGSAFCNGQLMPINQNTALFSLLGTTYGGDGVTTFGLPDLRGRVPVGTGSTGFINVALGEQSGTTTVTLTTPQLPPHSHNTLASTAPGTLQAPAVGAYLAQSNQRDAQYIGSTDAGSPVPLAVGGSVGNAQPVPIMQPYLGINFVIVVSGIYPSRN